MSIWSESSIHKQPELDAGLYRPTRSRTLSLVLLVSLTAIAVGVLALVVQAPVVLIAFSLLGVGGLQIARRWTATESRLFMLAYSCNVLAVMALYVIYSIRYGSPYYIGGSDDLAFELWARDVASTLGVFDYSSIRGSIVSPFHGAVGYVYLVSLLYRLSEPLGGFHTAVPRLLNSFCLAVMAILVFRIARQQLQLGRSICVGVALAVGLAPIMMYNAAHTFRDTIVALLLLWLVYVWSGYGALKPAGRWAAFLFTPPCILALWEMRTFAAIAASLFVFVAWWYPPQANHTKRRAVRPLLSLLLLIFALGAFRYLDHGGQLDWFLGRADRYRQTYTAYRAGLSEGLGQYVFGDTPQPINSLLRILYLLISPFPVFSLELERLWLSMGTIFQFFFLPFLGLGLWKLGRQGRHWPIVVAFATIFSGVALLTFTGGRHISMYYPFAALIAGYGFDYYRQYGRRVGGVWLFMYFLGLVGLIAYLAVKL